MGRQKGYALLLLMLILGLSFAALLGGLPDQSPSSGRRSGASDQALLQARDALIGYAATYGDSHSGEVFGYLPLPDMGGHVDNSSGNKEGSAAVSFAGNDKDRAILGRLPWRALGLPPLRDEYGECLWYAVAGSFKYNPKTDYMNWDTQGNLDLYTADGGRSQTGSDPLQRPVAIIFSPGPPLPGQNRADSTETDDDVRLCHGNYDARNFLDPYGDGSATRNLFNWFAGTTHDALGPTVPGLAPFLAGPLPGVSQVLNDRAVFITAEDIFRVVKQRRQSFADFINLTVIPGALACVPAPKTAAQKGNAIATPACAGHPQNTPAAKWWDQFFYLVCPTASPRCLTVNGLPCNGALIFAGERTAGQSRPASGRASPENYLEETLAAFQAFNGDATVLTGASAWPGSPASRDVVTCVP